MRLYCATTNAGKLREFERAFAGSFELQILPGLASLPVCEETGTTFEANAIQKALYYGKHADGYLFAEDSGLEVDALGGEPGVYSARYAGTAATDEANNQLVLKRMAGISRRTARFVCVIALATSGQLVRTFRGEVEGQLTEEARGANGFGYDPLFFYPPFGCTLAEAPLDRKMEVSHRSKALKGLLEFLKRAESTQTG